MQTLIVVFVGVILGITSYKLTKLFFDRKSEKENVVEDENYFVLRRPRAKVMYNTLILLFWVIVFSLYMNGLIFNKSIVMTVFLAFIILVTFFKIQKMLHKKIVIDGDIIIDTQGVQHYFTEFTDCNVVSNGAVLFIDGEPIIRVENDNIGYDVFLKKVKQSNIKFHDGRKHV